AIFNLVAILHGEPLADPWANRASTEAFLRATSSTLAEQMAHEADWLAWPIHIAPEGPWTCEAPVVLLGDAAHAAAPFAAQGAAMAIEDAAVLAKCLPPPGQ